MYLFESLGRGDLAAILFLLMGAPMFALLFIHLFCRWLTFSYPEVMPDKVQRARYRRAEASMAFACLAMLYYGLALLPDMVAICAVDPLLGLRSHGPWILAQWLVLFHKWHHMERLIQQAMTVSGQPRFTVLKTSMTRTKLT